VPIGACESAPDVRHGVPSSGRRRARSDDGNRGPCFIRATCTLPHFDGYCMLVTRAVFTRADVDVEGSRDCEHVPHGQWRCSVQPAPRQVGRVEGKGMSHMCITLAVFTKWRRRQDFEGFLLDLLSGLSPWVVTAEEPRQQYLLVLPSAERLFRLAFPRSYTACVLHQTFASGCGRAMFVDKRWRKLALCMLSPLGRGCMCPGIRRAASDTPLPKVKYRKSRKHLFGQLLVEKGSSKTKEYRRTALVSSDATELGQAADPRRARSSPAGVKRASAVN
jgi:hypothetical protein